LAGPTSGDGSRIRVVDLATRGVTFVVLAADTLMDGALLHPPFLAVKRLVAHSVRGQRAGLLVCAQRHMHTPGVPHRLVDEVLSIVPEVADESVRRLSIAVTAGVARDEGHSGDLAIGDSVEGLRQVLRRASTHRSGTFRAMPDDVDADLASGLGLIL